MRFVRSLEHIRSSSNQPIEIIWQKNAVLIDQSSGRFHIGPYNRTLEVRGITADDQGIYSCHVRIRYSDAFVNATAQLTVRGNYSCQIEYKGNIVYHMIRRADHHHELSSDSKCRFTREGRLHLRWNTDLHGCQCHLVQKCCPPIESDEQVEIERSVHQ